MRLPNAHFVIVPVEKPLGYLLDERHPTGRHKARIFRSAGYSQHHIGPLRRDLLELARSNAATLDSVSTFGEKWRVSGVLIGPTRGVLRVRTIWMIPRGGFVPQFVTAFPERTRS